MPKSLLIAGLALALVASATSAARADNCETFPGSQQYTDQGCDKPYDDSAAGRQDGTGPARPKWDTGLREKLRRALSQGTTPMHNSKTSSKALANAVSSARTGVQRALDEAANASDPKQLAKAQRDYKAAMIKLDRAYDAAANAASPQGEAQLVGMKQNDDANFGSSADRYGLLAPIQTQPAQAPLPPLPNNITEVKGLVYVCDGALAGANNVSCREISADGQQCTNVMIADGDLSWRDSIQTPCRAGDLTQRDAFLGAHPDIAANVDGRDAPFAMDGAGTRAEINRLTGQPDDPDAGKAAAAMSPQCRAIVQRYIAAAQASNGAAATAEYAELKQAGGCGVLQEAERQRQHWAGDPRFISRGDTPMLDQTFGACDKQPDLCNQIANQLKAGTSPEAVAAMYSNAIGIGLELGAMMGNAVLNAQARMATQHAVSSRPNGPRGPTAQYPRAINCNYSGCVTTNGLGPSNHQSDITGIGTH